MQHDRIICWFSCGAASAVATKLAIAENNGKLPLVIVRCWVAEEHPDNDRFAADCEKWFGQSIVTLQNEKYSGSIYEVFRKESYISGIAGAPCTRLLKKEVRKKFQKPADLHVFGYTADEQDRWDDFLDANNDVSAIATPLDKGLEHSDCLAIVDRAGIELPIMYKLGYKHNNCRGCCKSQAPGYWNKVRVDFPEFFERMKNEGDRLGVKLIKLNGQRIKLSELPPEAGNYKDEPEVQCGVFCHMAEQDFK